jgi:3',5'-cyclic AMP phosphodiesterase CpdA
MVSFMGIFKNGGKIMKRQVTLLYGIMAFLMFLNASPSLAGQDNNLTFAVFSDPHLYDVSLGTEGAAFEAYIVQDRKLIRESEAILDATIDAIIEDTRVKFVLVPGDLTKDGEKKSHKLLSKKLKKLEKAGIKVFVVPGNHDVNNPHAYRYEGEDEISVPNVSPQKFKNIYKQFGYKEALYEDPNSLSYVAEPADGLWLIAMDSCRYENNYVEGHPVTGGEFKTETLEWIVDKIAEGKASGKQMIGMMHHGAVEHYFMQSAFFPEYVVKDWPVVSHQLAAAGLSVVFTGHYHANDVTKRSFPDGSFVVDVETGSLVTFPNPYRTVTFNWNNFLEIESHLVTEIDYDTGGLSFPEYAETYLSEGLVGIAYYMLQTEYELPAGEPTLTYAAQLANAFKAHYAGDETPSLLRLQVIGEYLASPDPIENLIGQYLGTLWTDLAPADTKLTISVN